MGSIGVDGLLNRRILSCFIVSGSGRAGKAGELIAKDGSRYLGEILAGRPHGHGQYLIIKVASQLDDWTITGHAAQYTKFPDPWLTFKSSARLLSGFT